jgi:hypothetical protein
VKLVTWIIGENSYQADIQVLNAETPKPPAYLFRYPYCQRAGTQKIQRADTISEPNALHPDNLTTSPQPTSPSNNPVSQPSVSSASVRRCLGITQNTRKQKMNKNGKKVAGPCAEAFEIRAKQASIILRRTPLGPWFGCWERESLGRTAAEKAWPAPPQARSTKSIAFTGSLRPSRNTSARSSANLILVIMRLGCFGFGKNRARMALGTLRFQRPVGCGKQR